MATELGLDPSDPLNLLLHNSSSSNDTPASTSPSASESSDAPSPSSSSEQDDAQWSSLSSLWDPTSSSSASADGSTKPYPEMMPMDMDFSHLGLGLGMGMGMGVDPSLAMSMGMGMGFGGMGLGGMDMEFAQSGMPMVVDPSALHYDPAKFTSAHGMAGMGGFAPGEDQYAMGMGSGLDAADVLAAQFPFTFQFNHSNTHNSGEVMSSSSSSSSSSSASSVADSPQSFTKERRLSTSSTSTSSVSGASLSPVPESLPSPSPASASAVASVVADTQPKVEEPIPTSMDIPEYENDPAAELAARVRAAAGVMLAVPMTAQLQGYNGQVIPNAHSKLPIPRLPRQSPPVSKSTPSSSSSAASTPPPTTPPLSNTQVHTPATSIAPLKLSLNTQAPSYSTTSTEPTIIAAYTPVAPTPTGMTPTTGPTAGLGRPKTSHTTIERRYRTNLNARIQSLRMAVPALRVLEDRDGGNGKKIKKNLKGNVVIKGSSSSAETGLNDDGTPIDVIDERGFVDGVKVARKCSKANVLGKAVEYIRVLKKREMRLRREQEGLKKLIEGLVGGAALVKEWEREWRAVFGGEERDEVEGDGEGGEGEGEGGEDDGEEAEEEEEDDEEEEERKRKRARVGSGKAAGRKTAPERKKPAVLSVPPAVMPTPVVPVAAQPVGDAPAAAPEKRKRGRPRKVVAPPAPAAAPTQDAVMQDAQAQAWLQTQQQQGGQAQPQQYLLAVFALFSFFNSPLTSSSASFFASSSPHHAHTGTVLSAQPPLAYAPEIVHQFTPPPPSHSNAAQGAVAGTWSWTEYMQLFHLFVSVLVLLGLVASWMGVDVSRRLGASSAPAKRRGRSLSVRAFRARKESEADQEKERRGQGTRGWVGVAEESVLGGRASSLSLYDRIQIYRASYSSSTPSASTLTTLALVLHTTPGPTSLLSSLAKMRAKSVWEDAKRAAAPSPSPSTKAKGAPSVAHALVFDEVRSVEQALEIHSSRPREAPQQERGDGSCDTPLDVLARMVVKQRVKRHLGKLFVRAVAASSAPSALDTEEDFITFGSSSAPSSSGAQGPSQGQEADEEKRDEKEQKEWRRTIDAAREMGGKVEDLGRLFERVWKAPAVLELEDGEDDVEEMFGIRAQSPTSSTEDDSTSLSPKEEVDPADQEIRALLTALILYRRLFPPAAQRESEHKLPLTQEEEEGCITPTGISQVSALLSPPPSPRSTPRARQRRRLEKHSLSSSSSSSPSANVEGYDGDEDGDAGEEDGEEESEEAELAAERYKQMLFTLRRALGSRVFEQHPESGSVKEGDSSDASVLCMSAEVDEDEDEGLLEDARDRVVDLIVDVERRECRRAGGGAGVKGWGVQFE